MIKFSIIFIVFFCSHLSDAFADYSYDFVRISCIKEIQFLDIEYKSIHNTAIDSIFADRDSPLKIWSKHGFFSPKKLYYECPFAHTDTYYSSQITYKLVTKQAEGGNGMCGGAPEIFLSLYRNNELFIDNVVFGGSCIGNSSISHIYISGVSGKYPEEAQICFQKNSTTGEPPQEKCEWFFDNENFTKFKKFPINQEVVNKYFHP